MEQTAYIIIPRGRGLGATENAGVENAGVDSKGGKCRSGKCRSSLAVDGQLNLECKERQR